MIIINPGSGPVHDSTYFNAKANMVVFMADSHSHSLHEVVDSDQGDGRFRFFVHRGGRWHAIDMPGLPLAQVRYMGEPDQNIWDFPRLYVDGSSWVWKFAIDLADEGGDE